MTLAQRIVATFIALSFAGAGLAAPREGAPAVVHAGAEGGAACGDLLLDLQRKPPHLAFVGCRADVLYGLKALVADYQVEGRYAAAVEGYFMQVADLPALGFYCCGWDSIGKVGRDGLLREGALSFEVSMGSGETLVNRREDWSRIPLFHVSVTRYLEEP